MSSERRPRRGAVEARLLPIVALAEDSAASPVFGVEGIAPGPADSPPGEAGALEAETERIEAILGEASQLPRVGTLLLGIRPGWLAKAGPITVLAELIRRHALQESDVVVVLQAPGPAADLGGLDDAQRVLREQGFRLALDGFGSGIANLSLLERLEVDFLKIDPGFATGLRRDRRRRAIVRSITRLAQELGVLTISTGVERQHDLDVVAELGVPYAQGPVFSEPLSGELLARSLDAISEVRPRRETGSRYPQAVDEIAHELANLVAGISLLADQTLKWVTSGDPLHEDLRLILEAGERAVELTRRLQEDDDAAPTDTGDSTRASTSGAEVPDAQRRQSE